MYLAYLCVPFARTQVREESHTLRRCSMGEPMMRALGYAYVRQDGQNGRLDRRTDHRRKRLPFSHHRPSKVPSLLRV